VQRFNLEDEAQTLLTEWIAAIVSTPLPLPLPLPESENNALILGANNARQYWAEMAFILQVQSLYAWQIDRLMHRYIHPDAPRPALHPCQLEGMVTGFIDLVIEHAGRYYVLDYKSNKLRDYNKVQMQEAILAHRYDVQMTLYVLALHRLLKARLPGYDYDVHLGGALYLFLRGIDQPGAGLYACHPPKALIEAMDIAFSKTPATEIA
jgi:exodeoxyribonuclease V beta subunit